MIFGIIGIFRFKNFYARILISGNNDTVGAFTLIVGITMRHGLGFFSLKLLLLIILMIIINPLITHMTARSAWLSGYKVEDKDIGEDEDNV